MTHCRAGLAILLIAVSKFATQASALQIVVNTWAGVFQAATQAGYEVLSGGGSPLDAVEKGAATCEANKCDGSVGYGNHPDTNAETSLDALIMDGTTMRAGSVGYLRKYRDAVSLARQVLEYTDHTLLVGQGAEDFAEMLGMIPQESATTNDTVAQYKSWVDSDCQPNYYRNLAGDDDRCGPYQPTLRNDGEKLSYEEHRQWAEEGNHDTIGMVALNDDGTMACGTTTNGANHKIAGRVGDSPIVGAGCYVTNTVGGAACTGDGDIMMRFSPAFAAVQYMSQGMAPDDACRQALLPIVKYFPTFSGAIVCLTKDGKHGGSTYNMGFDYSVMSTDTDGVISIAPAHINTTAT
jgi:isoaspartyl peptidase/L-asparaginase-like protein (Ntn-hydrolase superfamily)